MYKILRRVSGSFLPRPDRPWTEDATSNAPTVGRKRRIDDDDSDEAQPRASTSMKRSRPETDTTAAAVDPANVALPPDASDLSPVEEHREGEDVKDVTKGVEEVELQDATLAAAGVVASSGVDVATSVESEPSTQPETAAGIALASAEGAVEGVEEPAVVAEAPTSTIEEPQTVTPEEKAPETKETDDGASVASSNADAEEVPAVRENDNAAAAAALKPVVPATSLPEEVVKAIDVPSETAGVATGQEA